MILNFWTSWSAPCLEELQRLQQLHGKTTTLSINELGVVVSIRLGVASGEGSAGAEIEEGPGPPPVSRQPRDHHG